MLVNNIVLFSTLAAFASAGDKGVVYSQLSYVPTCSNGCTNVNWAYNYEQTAGGSLPNGLDYAPMLSRADSSLLSTWSANAHNAASLGSRFALGFNEPDTQANNISPSQAAALWQQYMNPLAGTLQLVSPAVTNSGSSGTGLSWLSQFLQACSGCTVDYVAVHWYGTDVSDLRNFVSNAAQFGKPIWVTEFGFTSGSDDDKASQIQQAIAALDRQSSVFRYAYFGCYTGYELTSDGNALSAQGAAWCNPN